MKGKWEDLFEHARDWAMWSEHSHEEISAILGMDKGKRYYGQVTKASNALGMIERRWMKSIYGYGYRIETLSSFKEQSRERTLNNLQDSLRLLTYVNRDLLTEIEKAEVDDGIRRLNQIIIRLSNSNLSGKELDSVLTQMRSFETVN